MRVLKSLALLFGFASMLISSCSSRTPVSIDTETELPTVTLTFLPKPTNTKIPTNTPTITVTPITQSSNEPSLIVTLGEKVPSPWYPGIPVFSPDGQTIVLASSRIRFWDVNTHQLIREIENPYAEGCYLSQAKFSPDGKYFAVSITGCWKDENPSGHLLIWDTSTGDLIQEWTQEFAKMPGPRGTDSDYSIPVYAFAFLPDTTSIVFASGNTLETRDIFQNERRDVLKLGTKMYATQISLSSDGRLAYIIMSWEKDHDWPVLWTHQHKFQVWNINTIVDKEN